MKKYLYFAALIAIIGVSCSREKKDNCEGDLMFSKANILPSSSVANGILLDTEVMGSNLCYSFSHFTILKEADKVYGIRAYGYVPCSKQVCAQAIYYARPPGKIENIPAGTYTVHFYNYDAIFTTISVTIN